MTTTNVSICLMDTTSNDDELDKLIQETQDIWKSLKQSGVEVNDTINDPNDTNLDDIDQIASKLDQSDLHIANTNRNGRHSRDPTDVSPPISSNPLNISTTNNTDITIEDTSRTLQGLNLATPTNELSSLLFNDEPSKISQIRFSTPTNLKSTRKPAKDDESVPDTPFLFSPSIPPNESSHSQNITLSSPVNQIRVDREDRTHRIPNGREPIDFTENCWHEVNGLLSRNGFSILVKERELSPEIQICQRFKEILSQFGEHKDAVLQNKELKTQLHISSEKVSDLKQELLDMKQKAMQQDDTNDSMLINVKRQLEHCKGIVNQRNDEISRLKQKLQAAIEKEAIRRESAEAVFESINKRNARKNSKKDQQQMDLMAMYDEERKKMQNEIKFLRCVYYVLLWRDRVILECPMKVWWYCKHSYIRRFTD